MHRLIIGPIVLLLIQLSALAVRADRLEAIWIGPDGNGGEGNWNVPANWNLVVVPSNGTDGNGDGLPDIFDVRIDSMPVALSLVHNNELEVEVAGLRIDAGDALELTQPLYFTLRDPDGEAEVTNDGRIIAGESEIGSTLAFAGPAMRLLGNGTLQLGIERGEGNLGSLGGGGRLINGPDHTILTSGFFHRGRIIEVALTNEGMISVENGGDLTIRLYDGESLNFGTLRAVNKGLGTLTTRGLLRNHGLMEAVDEFSRMRTFGSGVINESDGVLRASNLGMVEIRGTQTSAMTNQGLIEATNEGVVRIVGGNVLNEGQGVIQARTDGRIWLTEGTFRPDPAIRLIDSDSTLLIHNALFENEGNVLQPPGPGVLQLAAHIRGGTITDGGIGRLVISGGATLEDVTLRGQATGEGMGFKGTISFPSQFSFNYPFAPIDGLNLNTFLGNATLTGPGVSRFGRTFISTNQYALHNAAGHQSEFGELSVSGNLVNNGVILTGGTSLQGGRLSGSGILVSSLVGLFNGSTLAPGDGIGTMPVFGRIWFGFRSVFMVELGPTESDLLEVTGNLMIDSIETNLILSGGTFSESYVIARYTGEREGMFTTITPGYEVIYDDAAKLIRVEVIPEPAGLVLAVAAMVVGVMMRRHRSARQKRGICR